MTTVGAVYWAWSVYRAGLRGWAWAFAAVALMMNPFVPIRMQRAQWQPIDLCLGLLLFGWSGTLLIPQVQINVQKIFALRRFLASESQNM